MHAPFCLPELGEGGPVPLGPCRVEVARTPIRSFPEGFSRRGGELRYRYRDVVSLAARGQVLRVAVARETPPEVVRLLVLGNGLAMVARARNLPVLHATTVRIEGRDVALLGPSGAGKSTLAGAVLREGAQLVADDLSVVVGGAVQPGLPRVKLWADTARLLGWDPARLSRVHPDFDKVSVPVGRVASSAPLSALVVVDPSPVVPALDRLERSPALRCVLANHRLPDLLDGQEAGRWLAWAAEQAEHLPVFAMRGRGAPADHARLLLRAVSSLA